jgi:hypothetical protein
MNVVMRGSWQPAVMPVCRCLNDGWDKRNLTVGDPALGDHRLRKFAHFRGLAPQHRYFETIFMIEMNVHRRHLQLVMRVMRRRKQLSQPASVVREHIAKRGDALSTHVGFDARPLKSEARQIADRLRPIVIVVGRHKGGELGRKCVGHTDRDTFHSGLPL